ncbi:arsenite methyltransferase [Saccharibacillus qingshengii]|uniref:arsenite methyltransferase n=1 Tax=Saccharibacillus qingshengii TaxID=1763540 RepID=UPI0015536C21|nr:arsenite methyltransferase [Saccharibacillus qingshengii]
MTEVHKDTIRQNVRGRYQQIALRTVQPESCCGVDPDYDPVQDVDQVSAQMGYSAEELQSAPIGANLGLGCGNPQAIAELKPGETVLDLGSGGGFDCFLAARQVGHTGRVIGVDMTPDMISKARHNAEKAQNSIVDFRLGEIEHLPVANDTVDVIISNCVINLSPDKQQVFDEAYRVLRSGGRLAISDIVTTAELPPEIKSDMQDLYSGCISGASFIKELSHMLERSGFSEISIQPKEESKSFIRDWIPGERIDDYIVSAVIQAIKP